VTVGASLLSNALRDDQRVRSLIGEVSGLKGVEAALRSGAIHRDALVSALVSYIEVKGDAASAELNSMSEHLASGNVSRVYLLHTDTMVGEVCGLALERHLRRRGITVDRVRI
jgi:CRISPR/Cas system-associated protein Csm6